MGCAPGVGRARRADVGAGTPCTRQTTQQRRDNSPRMKPSALRPWRMPGKDLQRCRSGQEVVLKSSWAHLRLGAVALGKGSKVNGPNGHSPSMVSLTAFRFVAAAAAAAAPEPLLPAMVEAEGDGRRACDPELERLPFSWAITPRVSCTRRTGSAPRARRKRVPALI